MVSKYVHNVYIRLFAYSLAFLTTERKEEGRHAEHICLCGMLMHS